MFNRMFRTMTMTALMLSVAASSSVVPLLNGATTPAALAAGCATCDPGPGPSPTPTPAPYPAPNPNPGPSLPALAAAQTDTVGPGFHMSSNVNLVRSGPAAGQIDVVTNTNTNNWGLGFTGGVFLLFRDADGAVIYVTQLRTFGVDAKSVFFGTSSRTDYWPDRIPGGEVLAGTVTHIDIIQQHTPRPKLASIMQQIDDYYKSARAHCQSMLGSACPLP